MSRVSLYFRERGWAEPEIGAHVSCVIRLHCWIQFRASNGALTKPYFAVVDTGAPLCMILQRIWRELGTEVLVERTSVGGISQRKECQVPAKLGRVRACLADAQGTLSPPLVFPAYLAKTNRAPLLLGFAGVLSEFRCYCDYEAREAWVETR